MRRFTLATILLVSSAACLSTPIAPAIPTANAALPRYVRVQLVEHGLPVVRDVPLEDYVRASAISEVAPAAGELETVLRMLEVQTIISRTYAVSHLARHAGEGFDLCSTTHCQLFDPRRLQTSRWAAASLEAVERTSGLILTFDRLPIQALFHADCGGHTSTAAAVWGGTDRPYLLARRDDGVPREAHVDWLYEVSVDVLTAALAADSRTRITGALDTIAVVARDDAGRAERIALHGHVQNASGPSASTEIRGDELRQVLTRAFGARTIRSTRFDVRRAASTFTFSGRGFGHGVGLCQAGALARLRTGATPADVLGHYYPGAVLSRTAHGSGNGSGLKAQGSSKSMLRKAY